MFMNKNDFLHWIQKKTLVSVDVFCVHFPVQTFFQNKRRIKSEWKTCGNGKWGREREGVQFRINERSKLLHTKSTFYLGFCFPFQLYSFTLWNTKYQTFHIHISSKACTNNTTNLCKCFKSDRENKKKMETKLNIFTL